MSSHARYHVRTTSPLDLTSEQVAALKSLSKMSDIVEAEVRSGLAMLLEKVRKLNPSEGAKIVGIWGSARTPDKPENLDPEYKATMELAQALASEYFLILTGAGPGQMQAGNHGAFEAWGDGRASAGIKINLRENTEAHEQDINPFCQDAKEFSHFFTRKLLLMKYVAATVATVGGFGTFDETFEKAALIVNGETRVKPIVFHNRRFYGPILSATRKFLKQSKKLDEFAKLSKHTLVSDNPKEIVDFLKTNASLIIRPDLEVDTKMIEKIIADIQHPLRDLPESRTHLVLHGCGCSKDVPLSLKKQADRFVRALRSKFTAEELPIATLGGTPLARSIHAATCRAKEKSVGLVTERKPICCDQRKSREGPHPKVLRIAHHFHMSAEVTAARIGAAHVFFPQGDLRTIGELKELVTLIQTKKLPPVPTVPIILVSPSWKRFMGTIKASTLTNRKTKGKYATTGEKDFSLLTFVDRVEDIPNALKPLRKKAA